MKQTKKKLIADALTYIILTAAALTLVFPFLWMVSGAFKNSLEVVKMPPQLFSGKLSFDNFIEIRKYFPLERFLLNSFVVSTVTTVLQLLFCSMAAFVFAKFRFKGRELLFMLYLITLMIPKQVTLVPLFIVFSRMKLTDTFLGLILPDIFSAFGTFLLRQHMMTIPDSFLEAAYMDGASYTKVFTRIMLPLSKPALATLGIFSFMYSWNNYLWPLIIINSKELMTLPLGLSRLTGRWATEWNILMAGNVISFIPILIVYLFAQNYFVKGLTLGGNKG